MGGGGRALVEDIYQQQSIFEIIGAESKYTVASVGTALELTSTTLGGRGWHLLVKRRASCIQK